MISGPPMPSDLSAGPDFLTMANKLGAISTLRKPFKAPALRTIVANCLEAARKLNSTSVKSARGIVVDP